MPDYYDSWSANKRKKNPTRTQVRVSSDRHWLQHQQQSFIPASTNATSSATTVAASTAVGSSRTQSFRIPVIARSPFSPALPRPTSDTPSTKDLGGGKQRPNTWRFSKAFFDSSTTTVLQTKTSHDTDFDDDDDDDDEEDGDDDDSADINEIAYHTRITNPYGNAHPRLPVMSGFSPAPSASNQRGSLLWSSDQSRLLHVQERHGHDHDLEQLNPHDDPFFSSHIYSNPMAKSSPSLPATTTASDNPHSTSTFNARPYPRLSLINTATDEQSTIDGLKSSRIEGRRPRPWSQVIWESPVLGGSSEQQEQHQPYFSHTRGHSVTVCSRPQSVYPALTKDLFTPRATSERERTVTKSVRINIDGDVANKNSAITNSTRASIRATDATSVHIGSIGNRALPNIASRRELSKGKKHSNRISLGTGFYVSIEPISLSAATPSTPKSRRQLVRLPARPQSVLIPSAQHGYSGTGLGGVNRQRAHQNMLPRQQMLVLQPLASEPSKRRRHKSQQLEMGHDNIPTSIPWSQLTPMDNAKTFHGIGSSPAMPIPILKRVGSQDAALEAAALSSTVPCSSPSLGLHPREKAASSKVERSSKATKRQSLSPPRQHPRPSSTQTLRSIQTTSRLYQSTRENPPSPFSMKQSASLSSSPQRATFLGSNNSSSPLSARHPYVHTSKHPQVNAQKQYPHRHSSLQTRPLISSNTCTTPSKSRWTLTALKPGNPFSNKQNINSSNSNGNGNNDNSSNDNGGNSNCYRSSMPLNNSSRLTSWKHNSSSLFPFSLVSYESGGLLGEIKNASTTVCTNAPSPLVTPGTPLPPGVIVSKGVPIPPTSTSPSTTESIPIILHAPSHESLRSRSQSVSPASYTGRRSASSSNSEQSEGLFPAGVCPNCGRDMEGSDSEMTQANSESDYCTCSSSTDTYSSNEEYDHYSSIVRVDTEAKEAILGVGMNDSVVIQKSHVAVYEINPRWGSRLSMLLVTIGGTMCAAAGSLCAEYHCQDLQFCQDSHESHGDWCGPSGVEGAPYMLTVGLSMCIFGIHALIYLRSPISRLVGYSEIDQFL